PPPAKMTLGARAPRALRSEVQHARGLEAAAGAVLSDCLREAGADVVTRGSCGRLLKTDVSPGALADGLEAALRAEIGEKTRALQALQRNYESISSLSAGQAQELSQLRGALKDVVQQRDRARRARA
ncbi:unnamed protein product, partial [Prorocentrum cordatum]